MSPKASKTKGRKTRKRSHQLEEPFEAFSGRDVIAKEFMALLEELDFVQRIINIYHRHELRDLDEWQKYGLGPSRSRFEQTFQRQAEFILKYLPDRLYQATDTLFIEAVLAAIGRPMRRSLAIDLYNSIFVRRDSSAPPLRDGRKEIWDPATLKWAIYVALPTIKNSRNVTLSTLAKRINALPRTGLLKNMKKNLTGKHLHKLFKEHRINWMRIKSVYKSFLEEKKRPQKST